MTGVAVKVTLLPAQTVVDAVAIETLTGRFGSMIIVMAFDVAGLPVTQGKDEVITTVTISPLVSIDDE